MKPIFILLLFVIFSTTGYSQSNNPNYFYSQARIFENNGQLDSALVYYDKTILIDNNNMPAHEYRANIYTEKEFFNKAIDEYTFLITKNSEEPNYYIERAFSYYMLDNNFKAREDLRKVLELNPKNTWAYSLLGYVAQNENKNVEAISYLSKSILMGAENEHNFYARGKSYFFVSEYKKAIRDFNKTLSIEPNFIDVHPYRGQAYYKISQTKKAHTDLLRSLKNIDASECQGCVYYYLGLINFDNFDFDKAISNYNKGIELLDDYSQLFISRGEAFQRVGDSLKSIPDFKKALVMSKENYSKDTTNLSFLFDIGWIQICLEDYKESLKTFEEYITYEPKDDMALTNIGWSYYKIGKPVLAEEYYNKSLQSNPKNAFALENLGIIYFEKNEMKKSSKYLKSSLSSDKNALDGNHYYGLVLIKQDKIKKGCKFIQKAIDLGNQNAKLSLSSFCD